MAIQIHKLSPLDTCNQVPIESKALGNQVFSPLDILVNTRSIMELVVTSKCAGELWGKKMRSSGI